MAGILCGRSAANFGAGMAAHTNFAGEVCGKVGIAPKAGTTAASAARSRRHGACRDMGSAGSVQAGGDGFAAALAGCGCGGKGRRQQDWTLRFEKHMNEAETRAEGKEYVVKDGGVMSFLFNV
ncbi:protein of unknown function [Georgfuchsia toluolica]|uniref:Uncharacterized protein n=1 Tax=Georgfuchsia toluolica TaxID=424218 RepID=A0A916N9W8_9PROT|nr:protein of unknown function [Georgfuchsia toluolica]